MGEVMAEDRQLWHQGMNRWPTIDKPTMGRKD